MSISINDFKPEFVGRGQWHVMHTLASKTKTIDERKMVIMAIKTIVENLRCNACLKHALKYMNEHPIDGLEYSNTDLFKYLYDFHVSANKYAGKSSPSYEDIRKFYYENNERCVIEISNN